MGPTIDPWGTPVYSVMRCWWKHRTFYGPSKKLNTSDQLLKSILFIKTTTIRLLPSAKTSANLTLTLKPKKEMKMTFFFMVIKYKYKCWQVTGSQPHCKHHMGYDGAACILISFTFIALQQNYHLCFLSKLLEVFRDL